MVRDWPMYGYRTLLNLSRCGVRCNVYKRQHHIGRDGKIGRSGPEAQIDGGHFCGVALTGTFKGGQPSGKKVCACPLPDVMSDTATRER